MSPNLLVARCHGRLISEAYLLRKLKNLCRGAAASLSYKYPAWRICCGSNRVLGSLGGRLPRREQFRAEPCMKPLYCLELPVLPERRGQPLFTRSHTYTVCALVYSIVCACMCVFFGVCACSFYGPTVLSRLTALNQHWRLSLHVISLRLIMMNAPELGKWRPFSLDMSWVVLVFIIKHCTPV